MNRLTFWIGMIAVVGLVASNLHYFNELHRRNQELLSVQLRLNQEEAELDKLQHKLTRVQGRVENADERRDVAQSKLKKEHFSKTAPQPESTQSEPENSEAGETNQLASVATPVPEQNLGTNGTQKIHLPDGNL